MIPILLNIKGLYSYQENTTIDFQPLIDARLFGIFGAVGSGKSAILEAIMFVLFDRSTRLNKAGDDRYYNMMNLQSSEMVIDFIFLAGKNNQLKYRFYFKARRKNKDFSKVDVKDRSYYLWSKNDWQPIDPHQVVGMTYENFMQTVIIPQGKFREFIDQKPAARTQMLKELFHLEKYDIAPQAHGLLHEVRDRLTFLDGQLSLYQEITEKGIAQLKTESETLAVQLKGRLQEQKKLTARNLGLQELQALVQALLTAQEIFDGLNQEVEFYQKKEQQVRRFEKAQMLFKSKIELQAEYLKELKEKQQLIETSYNLHSEKQVHLTQAQASLAQVQQLLEDKDTWRMELEDLQLLIEYNKQLTLVQALTLAWNREQKNLLEVRNKEVLVLKELEHWKSECNQHKYAQQDYQLWIERDRWWARQKELQQLYEVAVSEWEKVANEIEHLKSDQKKRKVSDFQVTRVTEKIKTTQSQWQDLKIQENWQEHAQHLAEGKPCPLCGALEHPSVLTADGLQSALLAVEDELSTLQKEAARLQDTQREGQIVASRIKSLQEQNVSQKRQMGSIKNNLDSLVKEFPGKEKPFSKPEDLHDLMQKKQRLALSEQKAQEQLEKHQEEHRQIQHQNLQQTTAIQGKALKKEQLQGALEQKLQSLKHVHPDQFSNKSEADLKNRIKEIQEQSSQAQASFKKYQLQVQVHQQELGKQKTLIESLEGQVELLTIKSESLEGELSVLCQKEAFKSTYEVQKVLALNLNIEQERAEISTYRESLKASDLTLQKLKKQIGSRVYKENDHVSVQRDLEHLSINVEQDQHHLAGLEHALNEKQAQLKHKQTLTEQQSELIIRKDQLQEISNLLRGNGFINFISSAYLQDLCKMANVRFIKLTGNRLRLELNEQNDFMVRDFLNEGKLRLLKTLSGGQIFQASLCLALALAENVKAINQADQSFFFLDEGFGSLDKASMQIVFNTLKSLQKENRIVGIISHVDELQQEIEVYLTVHQVGEKGSVVTPSWEPSF